MKKPIRLVIPRLNAVGGATFGFLFLLIILAGVFLLIFDSNSYNKAIGLVLIVFMMLSSKLKDI